MRAFFSLPLPTVSNPTSPSFPMLITAPDTPSAASHDYWSLFLSQRRETTHPVALCVAEGSLPSSFPHGVYYLAGPGIFSDDYGSTVHPFDGHGYLRAFRFNGGGTATYAARYVETEVQMEERDRVTGAWRFSYRGPFSVLRGGRRAGNLKVMKNVANTSVVWWGSKLLCLWEGGEPYEVDPVTMETIGPFDVFGSTAGMESEGEGGVWGIAGRLLRAVLYGLFKMPPKRVLSHYKIDTSRKRLLVLSCNAEDLLLPCSNFTFYELDEGFNIIQRKHFSIPEHLMIHDWAFTENHYVIIGNRIKINIPGAFSALSGLSPMIAMLSTNPDNPTSPIYILPRFEEVIRRDWRRAVEAPWQIWAIHTANAFEEERDGKGNAVDIQLQATTCSYHWFNFARMFGYNWQNNTLDPSFMNISRGGMHMPTLVKMAITIDRQGNTRECAIKKASSHSTGASDFPIINPKFAGRRNAYVYVANASGTRRFLPHFPYDSITKIQISDGSTVMWRAGHHRFVGEPMFIPTGEEEDEGYVVVVEYAVGKERCYLVILDARRIGKADALVARLEVPEGLAFPLGFHGFWHAHST